MIPVFIYTLNDPTTGIVRYCGQTVDPDTRLRRHMVDARKEKYHCPRWVKSLLSKKLRPIMEIIDVVPDDEADFWEREYIQNFLERGFDLTNIYPGGEGAASGAGHPNWGRTGALHPCFGRKHTLEEIEKMKAASSGENNPNFGRKHPPDEIEKIKAARAKQVLPKEAYVKHSLTMFGKKQSHNTSGFAGVYRRWDNKKWCAELQIFKNKIRLGNFSKLEDAVFVRALAVDKLRGSV